jgi:hypothetical protein
MGASNAIDLQWNAGSYLVQERAAIGKSRFIASGRQQGFVPRFAARRATPHESSPPFDFIPPDQSRSIASNLHPFVNPSDGALTAIRR